MASGATLVLPAPKNASTSDDGAAAGPSKATRVEDVDELTAQSSTSAASRYATAGGLIYPPPELRNVVDTTAQYVARNGIEFESKIRGDSGGSSRLAFLSEDDPYHAYYRAKLQALTTGDGPLANAAATSDGAVGANTFHGDAAMHGETVRKDNEAQKPTEPEPYLFSADLPNITALDLDVVKLTALFVAKRGRDFATELAKREGRSYQFEFLRPSHSLFGFFNRLVEQYRAVMEPSQDLLAQVRRGAYGSEQEPAEGVRPVLGMGKGGARLQILEDIRKRAEWTMWERERRKVAEDEKEKERALFNEIDWQDFVVVGTVELTETDAHIDLPPPMSLREVRNMSMAQKRMAAMIMDTGGDSADNVLEAVAHAEREGEREAQARSAITRAKVKAAAEDEGDVEMEVESDDDGNTAAATAKNTLVTVPSSANAPMKIRKDYQPKTLAQRKAASAQQTTLCPVCGQSVTLSEMDEHVRIELLNPQFREQRRELESRRAQHNALLEGADPSKVLKQFAGKRTDIFGGAAEEEAQRRREQEEAHKRKERETMVWDGHAASRVDTRDQFNRPEALQQEREQITKRFKTDQPKTYMGPQMGGEQYGDGQQQPSYAAPVHMQGATIQQHPSSAPMAPSGSGGGAPYNAPSGPRAGGDAMNYGQAGGAQSAQSYGMQAQHAPPMQYHQPPPPPPLQEHQHGLVKRTDGVLHPESQWAHYHPQPLRVVVQLPDNKAVSDTLNGGQVSFDALPPSTTIGSVRDRLQAETLQGALGASRLKLRVDGKATTLRQTLAHWNLVDGDTLTLQIS